ncbi:secreted protein [Xylaria nigripes]|nr:secreted protein [Xylaria nigripes]
MGFSKSFALGTATLALCANAKLMPPSERSLLARDPPTALPSCATDLDKKFQPAMDFDTDGCYNTPAIDANGNLNPGLDCGGATNGHCHDLSDLQNNNVYSRARCNNGWCGIIYGYYFEKDQSIAGSCGVGHKNDWEHIAVWIRDGEDMPAYVGVSQHGGYLVKAAADVRFDGAHPKVVYNQESIFTHDFRFANEDDDNIENATGSWFYGALVGYDGFPTDDLRNKMLDNDWGKALPDIRDDVFPGKLEVAKGGNDIPLDANVDDAYSPGEPTGC